jgi:hypothetical protein
MKGQLSPTFKICLSAMLLVLDIVATHVIRTPSIPAMPFLRLSLGPAIVIYASLFLGPFYGGVVGAMGDLLGILLFQGIEGQINPLLTVVYALLGILPALLLKLTRHFRKSLSKPYVLYGSMVFLLALLAILFYAIPSTKEFFASGFGTTATWAMPLILGLTAFFDIVGGVGLFYSNKYFNKHGADSSLPSPYEIASICLVLEIVLMVFLKPLAFYVFYNWMASDPFPISYSVLLLTMLVFSSLAITINSFGSTWLLYWSVRFSDRFGFSKEGK